MIKDLETTRLKIKQSMKEDTDFCLDIWLDDTMGKYLSDPPRNKITNSYLNWKETVEVYNGCYYFVAKENLASNNVLKKLGFYIEKEGFFRKSGTDIVYDEYTYRLDLD